MSRALAVMVSSPFSTRCPSTEPASASTIVAPSLSRASFMRGCLSPLDGADAPDLLLQQQHPVKQRLGSRRAARHVDVDRHDAVTAAYDRIRIMVIAAAVRAR